MPDVRSISRCLSPLRAPLLALTLLAVLTRRGVAQDRFEIEVYPYETAARGEWELDTHLNYTRLGVTTFDGRVAPTQGQVRLATELTHGVTDSWEVAGYLLAAHRAGAGAEFAGWRLRSRLRAPLAWPLPVRLGLNVELEAARPAYSDSPLTLELVPVFEKRFGRWQFNVDPVIEHDLAGPAVSEGWELEPRARAAVAASRAVTLALEYYGALGHVGALLPGEAQVHQFFPSVELRLGEDVLLSFGVGVGATSAGDRLVFKSRFEMPLGGERN